MWPRRISACTRLPSCWFTIIVTWFVGIVVWFGGMCERAVDRTDRERRRPIYTRSIDG